MNVPYQIIKSTRKTISIQIKLSGEVVVRAPKWMRMEDIRNFVESKNEWIDKNLAKLPLHEAEKLTAKELEMLREQTRELVTQRAAHYAPIVGVSYKRITVRSQHTRWGSCSSKGNLNFNCLLALVPTDVLDYVVVHELCHRVEMNHSVRFWAEVERVLPDYRSRKRWLKENGTKFIAKL